MNETEDLVAAIVTYPGDVGNMGDVLAIKAFVWTYPDFKSVIEWDLTGTNAKFTYPTLALSPDGKKFAVAITEDRSKKNPKSKILVRTLGLDSEPTTIFEDSDQIRDIQFHPDGTQIAVALGTRIAISGTEGDDWVNKHTLDHSVSCKGMRIDGAIGLNEKRVWMRGGAERKGTLAQYLKEQGAILTKKQPRRVTKGKAVRTRKTTS